MTTTSSTPTPNDKKIHVESTTTTAPAPTLYSSSSSSPQVGETQQDLHQTMMYESAVSALFSPLHQATTSQALAESAARRMYTVEDMRYYWQRIIQHNHDASEIQKEENDEAGEPPPTPRPTMELPMIHITGTKGKGSTACFCESLLRTHYGYRTGLFTSPHLMDVRERIRIDGRPVHPHVFGRVYWTLRKRLETTAAASTASAAAAAVAAATTTTTTMENDNDDDDDDDDDHLPLSSPPPPTLPGYFRMLTLMALYTFQYELRKDIDVIVVEVGMGGRYDATNFLDMDVTTTMMRMMMEKPTVCGVTLLDLDHTRVLGDTLTKIAWEKGGIFAVDKADKIRISPRPESKEENEQEPIILDHGKSEIGTMPTDLGRRQFFIMDSNSLDVMNVMRQCARIEGQGGQLVAVDAKGTLLRDALQKEARRLGLSGPRTLGLAGDHQYGNATLAVTLCRALVKRMATTEKTMEQKQEDKAQEPLFDLDTPTILDALVNASWPGRCQTFQPSLDGDSDYGKFTFYLDGAHTPQSLEATVNWFMSKVNPNDVAATTTTTTLPQPQPILVFNCSHERNPIELLELLSSSSPSSRLKFSRVYFPKSDSTRPSAVTRPSAAVLLEQRGLTARPELLTFPPPPTTTNIEDEDTGVTNDNPAAAAAATTTTTWQETLASLWRHIEPTATSAVGDTIFCNMTATQVLEDLKTLHHQQVVVVESSSSVHTPTTTPVLVTGSLYLVGSFLSALGWAEESSSVMR